MLRVFVCSTACFRPFTYDAVVVGLNSKMFKAKCSDGSKWDVVIMKKRTGLFPKGDWTHKSAAAAAYAGVEQEAQSDDDL